MADIKISELTTASQINNGDNIELSQDSGGGNLVSLKATILAVATKILKGINFTSDLQTTDKTIIGAINEAAQGGGGGSSSLAGLSDVDIDDQTLDDDQVLVWDSVNEKWVNADQSGQGGTTVVANPSGEATDDLLKVQIGSTIYNIPGGGDSIFSGKSLVMKTKTYTGTGSAVNAITFDEKPYAIYSIFGDGYNQSNKVMMLPFIYGETTYCVGSYYTGSGILWNPVAYSNNDLTMTMSSSDAGAAFNNEGSTYTIWYLVEENFNEFTEVSGVLEAGETEITLYNPNITSDSTVEPFTSKFGLSPTNMQISGNDFTAKQYLEVGSTVGPYIDTGLTSTRDTYCEIKFACTDNPTNNTWFFGAFSSVGIILGYQNSAIEGCLVTGGNLVNYDTNEHIVEIKADGIYLDGVKKQTGDWSRVPENIALYLFSRGGDNPKINNFKIYYAKIWQNSTLVRNFIPAERHSDNEIGLLDLITSTFYTNDGTGDFIAGPTDSSIPQIGSVALTFPVQSSDVNVKVRVS